MIAATAPKTLDNPAQVLHHCWDVSSATYECDLDSSNLAGSGVGISIVESKLILSEVPCVPVDTKVVDVKVLEGAVLGIVGAYIVLSDEK